MILRAGEWTMMHAVQVAPGEINTAYVCDSQRHAEKLRDEYRAGRPDSTPTVVRVYVRADVISTSQRQPSELEDWIGKRDNSRNKGRSR